MKEWLSRTIAFGEIIVPEQLSEKYIVISKELPSMVDNVVIPLAVIWHAISLLPMPKIGIGAIVVTFRRIRISLVTFFISATVHLVIEV